MTRSYMDSAIADLRQTYTDFRSVVIKGLGPTKSKKLRKVRKQIRLTMASKIPVPTLTRGNMVASLRFGELLIRQMVHHKGLSLEAEGRGERQTRYWFLTFIRNDWTRSDRKTQINIPSIKNAVSGELRRMGLSGIVVIEIDGINNFPQEGKGLTLCFHAHAIAWSQSDFDRKKWQQELASDPRWMTTFGTKPLKVKPLKPDTIDNRFNIASVARYLMKAPSHVKYRKPMKKPGKFELRPTKKGYQPILALRIAECLTQMPFRSIVCGVGEGRGIVRTLFAGLEKQLAVEELDSHQDTPMHKVDVAELWLKLRQLTRMEKYEPVKFLTGRYQGDLESFVIPPQAVPRKRKTKKGPRRTGKDQAHKNSNRPGWTKRDLAKRRIELQRLRDQQV